MRFVISIVIAAFIITSCNKARKCECVDSYVYATEDTTIFYINGNKKDSKKACANLADSTEVCTLKDK